MLPVVDNGGRGGRGGPPDADEDVDVDGDDGGWIGTGRRYDSFCPRVPLGVICVTRSFLSIEGCRFGIDTRFGSMDTTDLECININIEFRRPMCGRMGSRSGRGVSSLNSANECINERLERGVTEGLAVAVSFRALSLLFCFDII